MEVMVQKFRLKSTRGYGNIAIKYFKLIFRCDVTCLQWHQRQLSVHLVHNCYRIWLFQITVKVYCLLQINCHFDSFVHCIRENTSFIEKKRFCHRTDSGWFLLQVTEDRHWKHVYDQLGGHPGNTSAATCTRRIYEKWVLSYWMYSGSCSDGN